MLLPILKQSQILLLEHMCIQALSGQEDRLIGMIQCIDCNHRCWGAPLLFWAARGGHTRFVRALLSKGVHIDSPAFGGKTPLFIAAKQGHEDVVQLLLEAGAEKNSVTNKGISPLFIAAEKGYVPIVRLLLDARINVLVQKRNAHTWVNALASSCRK